mgnify:CR=1 FL=1
MGIRGIRPRTVTIPESVKQKRKRDDERHRDLCLLAGKWLRKPGMIHPATCPYVAVELVTATQETPDVFC